MDGSDFDTLTRAIARRGTRRWLVRLVASLPLVGVLAKVGAEEAAAQQRPIDRIQRRTPQRNRNQRNNNKNNNRNNNNKKAGGGQNSGGQNSGNRTANPNPITCRSAADCGGQLCFHGGCFPPCTTDSTSCQACGGAACQCVIDEVDSAAVCADTVTFVGSCNLLNGDADCPLGTFCSPFRDSSGTLNLCLQPCFAANGTVCGTSTHGGTTLRCCNGVCPDPNCLPSGVFHPGGCPGVCGDNGQNCCFANEGYGCLGGTQCQCPVSDTPGTACGSDLDCQQAGNATACICGTCQVPPS